MSLIDVPNPTPTLDSVVADIKQVNLDLYTNLLNFHTLAFNKVWSNPYYTPKEIIGAFGADAIPLFQLSSAIQNILASANPEYQPLVPTKTVDIDPNTGVVTIGD